MICIDRSQHALQRAVYNVLNKIFICCDLYNTTHTDTITLFDQCGKLNEEQVTNRVIYSLSVSLI